MIIDSNIVIYAAQPDHTELRHFIAEHAPAVSAISRVEVLGYPLLTDQERVHFEIFFNASTVLPITDLILEQAIHLRQQRKMTLGDALIAGTALVHHRPLVTHNVRDFRWISELTLIDPL